MNGRRDYYQVLGVPRDADAKASGRRSASWPAAITRDTSTEPDAQQRFAEIAEAYAVLSYPAKRASYDAHGFAGLSGAGAEDLWGAIDFRRHLRTFIGLSPVAGALQYWVGSLQ